MGLPITSKLLPFRVRNLVYLAEVAALTRMATGVVRVLENQPHKQQDPHLSPNEKRQAMTERFFVEILGTAGYMAFLHLGQDFVGKIYDRYAKIPQIDPKHTPHAKEIEQHLKDIGLNIEKFNKLINDLYKDPKTGNVNGLLHRVLYEEEKPNGEATKATLASLQKQMGALPEYTGTQAVGKNAAADLKKILASFKELENFALKNNVWASMGILTGVVLSATVGGTLTQLMNDRLVAPTARNWLNKKFKELPTKLNLPALAPIAPYMGNFNLGDNAFPGLTQNPANAFKTFVGNTPMQPINPPIAPVYLPNPKMQPPATAFTANTLPKPYTTTPPRPAGNPVFGGRV